MIDSQYDRGDSGGVWHVALTALMLIVAGLGVMAWDDSSRASSHTTPVATFHHR